MRRTSPSPLERGADESGRRWNRSLWLCLGFALILRLAYVVVLRTWHHAIYWDFAVIAESLLRHEGYSGRPEYYWFTAVAPTAFQAPLYTFFTAACYGLFGLRADAAHFVMQGVQSVVSAFCVFPVAAIGEHLHSRRSGLIAAVAMAVYPASIFLSSKLCASTGAILLLLWILLETLRVARKPSLRRSLLLGGMWGVMLLLYPTPSIFGLCSGAWLLFAAGPGKRRRAAACVGTALAATVLVISPWAVRNFLVFHRPVPTVTSFGLNLFIGNNDYATGSQSGLDYYTMRSSPKFLATYPWLAPERCSNDEIGIADRMFKSAVGFIRRHPARAGALFLRKFAVFWWSDPDHPAHGSRVETVYLVSYLMLLALGGLGLVQRARSASRSLVDGSDVTLVLLLMLSISCLHALTAVGQSRYRMLLEPALLPYAGIVVGAWWATVRRWSGARAARDEWGPSGG
jgi:hypothetical protein